jgi:hypothetical protein
MKGHLIEGPRNTLSKSQESMMKLVAVFILLAGLLCNSMMATAEGPIPFSELARTGGLQPNAIPTPDPGSSSSTVAGQTAHPHMTRGGKIMTGVGIGLLGFGAVLFGTGASTSKDSFLGSDVRAIGMGAGAAFAGVGTTLIVFGVHQKSTK